ncbi:beta-lactamase family protein [Aestuariibacter halophilus]|uniref:Beta-lactamase family protein n=1 Tax=Fluctibacter halophilus TaxID=226011 RepID=A0ABS8G7Q6_9ALTE|nr:serine hydrolase domain-containing protein [Aestuariibacter halophilus]MCC2616612.1 beta-lactamase family protein [Aestuariibacter halophilus]
MRHVMLFIAILLVVATVSYGWPVYQFFAHRDAVPMLPWGWQTIPDNPPEFNQVFEPSLETAGSNAVQALQQHRARINSPGISAAVAIEGSVVWRGGAGWADIEEGRAVSGNTQFRIGSTSKALTSTLLARMVDGGDLTLDEPLSSLMDVVPNPAWQAITPRQLASHMAGLPHYGESTERYGVYKFMALDTRYENVNEAVTLFDDSEVLFEPGEDFSYSSLGTVLLSAAMQSAGGKPFQDAMHERVLAPLGMDSTGPEPPMGKASPQQATFYWRNDESLPCVRPWRPVDLSHRLAGGGFVSTPSDLVKLGMGFADDHFIPADVREMFWTPQHLNNGEVNEQYYAIGWRVLKIDFGEGIGELLVANHGGVSRGSQSWLMVIPAYNMAVAVNINANTEVFWDFGQASVAVARPFILQRQQVM